MSLLKDIVESKKYEVENLKKNNRLSFFKDQELFYKNYFKI